MGNIVILDENTANKIAAGEVIERPASVVKELVENSIDAGASTVSVEIKNGGITYIKVTDNGSGIAEDDVEIAFERHATSKIRSTTDLESISTLGFRGEALASIAAVASVELITRIPKNTHGMSVKIQGGIVKDVKPTGCPVGTSFIIRDLFYNTPARFKFLKKDGTEAGYVSDIISRIALGKPNISLKLISNNSTIIHTPGNNELQSVIYSIYGKETAKEVLPVNYQDNKLRIWGYAGKPEIARSNRSNQSIFLNGRFIKSKLITSAIDEAYRTFLMKNKFPFIVLNMEINPVLVDVNVHPTKMEVRFSEEQEIFRGIYHAVSNALSGKNLMKELHFNEVEKNPFRFKNDSRPKPDYTQQSLRSGEGFLRENTGSAYPSGGNKSTGAPVSTAFDQLRSANDADKEKVDTVHRLESNINDIFTDTADISGKQAAPSKPVERHPEPVQEPQEARPNDKKVTAMEPPAPSLSEGFAPQMPQKQAEAEIKESDETKEPEKTFDFSEYVIVGQAFLTYIILQRGDELVLIDQHAAHERIMYERLKVKFRNKENLSQMLLAPLVLELTHKEIKFLEEKKTLFHSIGFTYEYFGNNSIILRSVPSQVGPDGIKNVFLEVLDRLINSSRQWDDVIADETLYTIACKAAVKANARLDDREIKALLEDMSIIDNPYTCPHGRPTAVVITKQELEKKFKRIV